jgi:hypothetical protein
MRPVEAHNRQIHHGLVEEVDNGGGFRCKSEFPSDRNHRTRDHEAGPHSSLTRKLPQHFIIADYNKVIVAAVNNDRYER